MFSLQRYGKLYKTLYWTESKEEVYTKNLEEKKKKVNMNTKRKESIMANKLFYNSHFCRPVSDQIRRDLHKSKSSYFFLNNFKSNLKVIQKDLNHLSEKEYLKLQDTVAKKIIKKFDKD